MINVNCKCGNCGSEFVATYEIPAGATAAFVPAELCDVCVADGFVTAEEYCRGEMPDCTPAGERC